MRQLKKRYGILPVGVWGCPPALEVLNIVGLGYDTQVYETAEKEVQDTFCRESESVPQL